MSRNDLIRAWRADGMPMSWIAENFRLHKRTIYRILNGEQDGRKL